MSGSYAPNIAQAAKEIIEMIPEGSVVYRAVQ